MRRVRVTKEEAEWLRRRKPRPFKLVRRVQVGLRSGFPIGSDGDLWWQMSLMLDCNRHCAEFWTDDETSAALHQLAEHLGYEQ